MDIHAFDAIGQRAEDGVFQMAGQGRYGIQTAPAADRLPVTRSDPGALAAAMPPRNPLRFAPGTTP